MGKFLRTCIFKILLSELASFAQHEASRIEEQCERPEKLFLLGAS